MNRWPATRSWRVAPLRASRCQPPGNTARSWKGRQPADQGSGTVLGLALVTVVLTLSLGALAVLAAVAAGHRAATAADLGALAAAAVLSREGNPDRSCAEAERIARANGATVTACVVTGEEVSVTAVVSPGWRGMPDAPARSRAGPRPSLPGDARRTE